MPQLNKSIAKKITRVTLTILFLSGGVQAQIAVRDYNADSLISLLGNAPPDTTCVVMLQNLGDSYYFKNPPTSFRYSSDALRLARKLNFKKGIAVALMRSGESLRHMGDYPEAVKAQIEAQALYKESNQKREEAGTYGFIGLNYFDFGEHQKAIPYLRRAIEMRKELKPEDADGLFYAFLGVSYSRTKNFDSAYLCINQAKAISKLPTLVTLVTLFKGMVLLNTKNLDSAFYYCKKALSYAKAHQAPMHGSGASIRLAEMFDQINQPDSSLYYARMSFRLSTVRRLRARVLESSQLLSKLLREKRQLDSALYYGQIAIAMTDSLYGKKKFTEWQEMLLQEQKRGQEIKQAEERLQNRFILIGLSSFACITILAGLILYRSNRAKQKSNLALEKSLEELKSTQSQLIQAEKMASLGELTAGIAHEIQNPLNFVNNFSELNSELINELEREASNGNVEQIRLIVKDVKENEQKINHHGKRADAIVKGMLQHSRSSSAAKEPTDINALADEYLRLAYHGLRAKDKRFNAITKTDFDQGIGKVNVVPQDIGRVILNLVTNAFYVVTERQKLHQENYEPTVVVSTKRTGEKILISVKDNGPGISAKVMNKIFQPFFTTKPTGQGTGLGLSLSYDIVRAHDGELKVETKEGEGSNFTIILPNS
jgi:signal transduction histidine kinase